MNEHGIELKEMPVEEKRAHSEATSRQALKKDRDAAPLDSAKLSPLGRRLLAIREDYIANGGRLYTDEEIDREISEARHYDPREDS